MAAQSDRIQDTATGEEIASTTIPPAAHADLANRNACTPTFSQFCKPLSLLTIPPVTDLMSPKKKKPKLPHSTTPKTDPARNTTFLGRDGLGAYITSPASFPASRVIYHDEKWVVINDLFPKSSIHLLLLPREPSKQLLHPFDAFEDPVFLREVQDKVKDLRTLVAKELHRRFSKYSAQDQKRERALEALGPSASDNPPAKLLSGRDWSKSVISGIHMGPSMNHLHVHILSIDRHSECMKHRKHYNSFSTPFLVDVEDFPLEKGDERKKSRKVHYLDWELKCWRCGMGFGNKFARLKEHLEGEFEEWRKE